MGRLVGTDYLLCVRHAARQVHRVVNRFLDSTVIAKFQLPPAAPNRLAKRIAVRAFRKISADARGQDRDKLYVSIGSFLYDPFERYTAFSDELHQRLRLQTASDPHLVSAERFYPSHLLREFQLARGGLTHTVAASLAAPPSDILIVGQFGRRTVPVPGLTPSPLVPRTIPREVT